jgi:hypothetical protein
MPRRLSHRRPMFLKLSRLLALISNCSRDAGMTSSDWWKNVEIDRAQISVHRGISPRCSLLYAPH